MAEPIVVVKPGAVFIPIEMPSGVQAAMLMVCDCGSCPFPYSVYAVSDAPNGNDLLAVRSVVGGVEIMASDFAPVGEYSVDLGDDGVLRFGRGLI